MMTNAYQSFFLRCVHGRAAAGAIPNLLAERKVALSSLLNNTNRTLLQSSVLLGFTLDGNHIVGYRQNMSQDDVLEDAKSTYTMQLWFYKVGCALRLVFEKPLFSQQSTSSADMWISVFQSPDESLFFVHGVYESHLTQFHSVECIASPLFFDSRQTVQSVQLDWIVVQPYADWTPHHIVLHEDAHAPRLSICVNVGFSLYVIECCTAAPQPFQRTPAPPIRPPPATRYYVNVPRALSRASPPMRPRTAKESQVCARNDPRRAAQPRPTNEGLAAACRSLRKRKCVASDDAPERGPEKRASQATAPRNAVVLCKPSAGAAQTTLRLAPVVRAAPDKPPPSAAPAASGVRVFSRRSSSTSASRSCTPKSRPESAAASAFAQIPGGVALISQFIDPTVAYTTPDAYSQWMHVCDVPKGEADPEHVIVGVCASAPTTCHIRSAQGTPMALQARVRAVVDWELICRQYLDRFVGTTAYTLLDYDATVVDVGFGCDGALVVLGTDVQGADRRRYVFSLMLHLPLETAYLIAYEERPRPDDACDLPSLLQTLAATGRRQCGGRLSGRGPWQQLTNDSVVSTGRSLTTLKHPFLPVAITHDVD